MKAPNFSGYVGNIPVHRAQFGIYRRERGTGWRFVDACSTPTSAIRNAASRRGIHRIRYSRTGHFPEVLARMQTFEAEV